MMKSAVLVMFTFCSIALAAPLEDKAGPTQGSQKRSAPKSKANRTQQTLTGCVDEQNGIYVLLDDHMLKKLADLEAANAGSEDFFAKHLGHKVTIKGTTASETEGKFKVSTIEDVASVCSPDGDATQK
jgi:hypothetical protein